MSLYCSICENSAMIDEKDEASERKKKFLILYISGSILVLSILLEFVFKDKFSSQFLALIVVLISGYSIIKEGIEKLLQKKITINLLMTVAAIGAFIIGHGGEAASLMFLYFIAEFLEEYAKDRSKKSITSLMKLSPDTAMVKKNGSFIELHTHDVNVGDIIQVKPGDTIPLDGEIIKGSSSINEASLTGESIPTFKKVGDVAFAGTINCEGYLEIKTNKTSDQTFIAKIKNLIEDAKNQKSSSEKFIDEFAKYYTPLMIVLAILVMLIPPLLFQLSWEIWIYRGLTLLVISCPCALALATPISTVSALNSGSKNGILIKGGKYLEEMNKIQIIAFDKTGTLTEGILEVADVLSFNGRIAEWFGIITGLEQLSEHPISKAIIKEANKREIEPIEIDSFKSITGKGVTGKHNDQQYYLGNKALFQDLEIEIPEAEMITYMKEGKTVILFGSVRKVLGLISLQDKIREESGKVISELENRKIQTILISGDNQNTVKATQKALGIDEIYFELKPDEKQEIIKQKTLSNKNIAMVGDGVNDAPSLALANVGIAMGGIGSDVSLETADVVLMKDDLNSLITLIEISKKTNYVVKENIYFAILVKLLFVILTFFGMMTLYLAVGIGDLGVTLIVILNAFRISKVKGIGGLSS
ncbi:MAG: heavy metal translocating P-type ATPase [Promethearchaeota archaeon]